MAAIDEEATGEVWVACYMTEQQFAARGDGQQMYVKQPYRWPLLRWPMLANDQDPKLLQLPSTYVFSYPRYNQRPRDYDVDSEIGVLKW